MQSAQPEQTEVSNIERDGGGMRAPSCGLMTALVTGALICDIVIALSFLPQANAQRGGTGHGFGWQTFQVKQYGTTVDYPATIFSEPAGKAEKGTGQRFNSADGRSTLTIYALENAEGDTPASYLRKNLRMPRSAIDYERVTRSFFAISVERQGTVLYSRCNFASGDGGTVHCIDLVYPQDVARAWDGIVTRISRSLRPLEG
jgi:hypothetical protein